MSIHILVKGTTKLLPYHTDDAELVNIFAKYFKEKIANIRKNLDKLNQLSNIEVKETPCLSLTQRCEVIEADLIKLTMSGNSQSWSLDPAPSTLLKKLMPVILTPIHNIINKSVTEKNMPAQLKQAIVKPLLKKASLDKENLKNHHPINIHLYADDSQLYVPINPANSKPGLLRLELHK